MHTQLAFWRCEERTIKPHSAPSRSAIRFCHISPPGGFPVTQTYVSTDVIQRCPQGKNCRSLRVLESSDFFLLCWTRRNSPSLPMTRPSPPAVTPPDSPSTPLDSVGTPRRLPTISLRLPSLSAGLSQHGFLQNSRICVLSSGLFLVCFWSFGVLPFFFV